MAACRPRTTAGRSTIAISARSLRPHARRWRSSSCRLQQPTPGPLDCRQASRNRRELVTSGARLLLCSGSLSRADPRSGRYRRRGRMSSHAIARPMASDRAISEPIKSCCVGSRPCRRCLLVRLPLRAARSELRLHAELGLAKPGVEGGRQYATRRAPAGNNLSSRRISFARTSVRGDALTATNLENIPISRDSRTELRGRQPAGSRLLGGRCRGSRLFRQGECRHMKRSPPENSPAIAPPTVLPSDEHAGLALREAAVLLAPMASWLIRHGVSYPVFAELLKSVFVTAAADELTRSSTKPTQSALSLLSGVHRKDVRAIASAPAAPAAVPRPPLASQVLTRWLTDSRFRGADGRPRALKRSGSGRTFEGLCRELSNDVHPRTVFDELLRLGQVVLRDKKVVVVADSYVPTARLDEMTALFSANAGDHIAAAVSNLTTNAPKFLEQSIYADGLTHDSASELHIRARAAWARAFTTFVKRARTLVDRDAASAGQQRVRFGVYFFSETTGEVSQPGAASPSKRPPSRRNSKKRQP